MLESLPSKFALVVSYGWQDGCSRMAEINMRMAALDEACPWRWQFILATGLEGAGWGGTKVGPDLWCGSFKDFPLAAFAAAMHAAGWEDPDAVQVMVCDAEQPWRVYRLADLPADRGDG